MIRFLQRKEIDIEKWNSCIQQSPNGQIFVFSWYLDICCEGWCGLVEDDYQSVFPLAIRKKVGISYLYQPFFTRHFGVFSTLNISKELQLEFLSAIPPHLKFWDFCMNRECKEITADIYAEKKTYQTLSLNTTYSAIRDRYNENLRRNLKKSATEEYICIFDFSPEKVVEQFHHLQKDKLKAFSEDDYLTLKNLMNGVTRNADYKCIAVQNKKKEIVAGAFFMNSHNRIVYLKGFSNEEGKKNGAMHFLFDQLIKQEAGSTAILDFGGSSVESVARFYKSLGANDSVYLHLHKNRLPKILRWIKRR